MELKAFDIFLSKEIFDSEYDGGLLSLMEGMTWQLTDVTKSFIYPVLVLWHQEMRDELFSLLQYDKFNPVSQNVLVIPDFENIDGNNFKAICEKGSFKNYCKLAKQVPPVRDLFKVLKFAGTAGTFKSEETSPKLEKLSNKINGSSSKLESIPMCWFGNKTGIYINTPELSEDQSLAYYLYDKKRIDEALFSALKVISNL